MLVSTMIGEAPELEELGRQFLSSQSRGPRPFHNYILRLYSTMCGPKWSFSTADLRFPNERHDGEHPPWS